MPSWYEVFENEQVQVAARRKGARLAASLIAMLITTLIVLTLGYYTFIPSLLGMGMLLISWPAFSYLVFTHIRALRRKMWCIKVSCQGLTGYDFSRHKIMLKWEHIRNVQLSDEGLLVIGPHPVSLAIPASFSDFPRLSHLVFDYAEDAGAPIMIDGQPWQSMDVYSLFPVQTD